MNLHGLSFLVVRFSKRFHYRQTIRAGMPPRRGGFCDFRPARRAVLSSFWGQRTKFVRLIR
ncbi:hypothetical protein BURCENBC7_AP3895 [Burkholderia cenocepacia BC7]|nr:hypothetical protein BURCENBC7_AP3895 [Burkholderia cenocepacia BC7]